MWVVKKLRNRFDITSLILIETCCCYRVNTYATTVCSFHCIYIYLFEYILVSYWLSHNQNFVTFVIAFDIICFILFLNFSVSVCVKIINLPFWMYFFFFVSQSSLLKLHVYISVITFDQFYWDIYIRTKVCII